MKRTDLSVFEIIISRVEGGAQKYPPKKYNSQFTKDQRSESTVSY